MVNALHTNVLIDFNVSQYFTAFVGKHRKKKGTLMQNRLITVKLGMLFVW